eukprot:gene12022-13263_t
MDIGADVNQQANQPPLENTNPETLVKLSFGVVTFFEKYGWLVVLAIVSVWLIIEKFKPVFYKWRHDIQEYQDKKNEDPNEVFKQQESMELARRKMQEKLNADAARHKERQDELAMQKRREKIEDWERHRLGKGYRSKLKKSDENEDLQSNTKPKPKFKKPLRQNDYNPLTGQNNSGSSSCFRPSARGGPSGGG